MEKIREMMKKVKEWREGLTGERRWTLRRAYGLWKDEVSGANCSVNDEPKITMMMVTVRSG